MEEFNRSVTIVIWYQVSYSVYILTAQRSMTISHFFVPFQLIDQADLFSLGKYRAYPTSSDASHISVLPAFAVWRSNQ